MRVSKSSRAEVAKGCLTCADPPTIVWLHKEQAPQATSHHGYQVLDILGNQLHTILSSLLSLTVMSALGRPFV